MQTAHNPERPAPAAGRRAAGEARWRSVVSLGLLAASAVVLLSVVVTPHLGLRQQPLVYVVVAFRTLFLVGSSVFAGVVAAIVAIIRWRRSALIAALLTFLVAVGFVIPSLNRALKLNPTRIAASGTSSLRILSWNTDQDDVLAETIATLVTETKPDVVVLPEYFPLIAAHKLSTLARTANMQMLGWDASAATVLVSNRLGGYHLDNRATPPWAGLLAIPSNARWPRLVVAHLQRPSLTSTALWRRHIAWASTQCSTANTIAVGDFNATVGNLHGGGLGPCRDAATSLGHPVGTWPTSLPPSLGATIDHVFLGAGWHATTFGVLSGMDNAGSDHRPIFAIVVPTS